MMCLTHINIHVDTKTFSKFRMSNLLSNRATWMKSGADNLSLGPTKATWEIAAKTEWLLKHFRHDGGAVHNNLRWPIKVVPWADRLYRWIEAERKRRPANRPYPKNVGLLSWNVDGCSRHKLGGHTSPYRKVKCVRKQYHKIYTKTSNPKIQKRILIAFKIIE